MRFPYEEAEDKLGYRFKDKELLKESFTHSTYANKYGGRDNERMEYLGDSVLQLIVTEWQYQTRKNASEGELTKERQKLVCEDALFDAVGDLDIENYLLTYGGRANVGKKTISSLFETVVAAIYLDGGYGAAKKFVLEHGLLGEIAEVRNPKGALQEFLQQRGEELPVYRVEKKGKDKAPVFRAEVEALGLSAVGRGKSKRAAEQEAASILYDKLTDRAREEAKKTKNEKRKNKADIDNIS